MGLSASIEQPPESMNIGEQVQFAESLASAVLTRYHTDGSIPVAKLSNVITKDGRVSFKKMQKSFGVDVHSFILGYVDALTAVAQLLTVVSSKTGTDVAYLWDSAAETLPVMSVVTSKVMIDALVSDMPGMVLRTKAAVAVAVFDLYEPNLTDYNKYFLQEELEQHYQEHYQQRLATIQQMLIRGKGAPDLLQVEQDLLQPVVTPGRLSPTDKYFLDILLHIGQRRCHYPPQMTVEQRDDPYQEIILLRPFYLLYMVSKELPAHDFDVACFTRGSDITLFFQGDPERDRSYTLLGTRNFDTDALDRQLEKHRTCRHVVILVDLVFFADAEQTVETGDHVTALLVDFQDRLLEYFEPNGPQARWIDATTAVMETELSRSSVVGRFEFSSTRVCPKTEGIQEGPFCSHWSILYLWLRVACTDCSANDVIDYFLSYSPRQRAQIIKGFTCHMWNSVAAIGLLGTEPDGGNQVIPTIKDVQSRTVTPLEQSVRVSKADMLVRAARVPRPQELSV